MTATAGRKGALEMPPSVEQSGVQQLSREESRAILDTAARQYLGISGQEFIERREAGAYDACADQFPVRRVAMLRHLAQ